MSDCQAMAADVSRLRRENATMRKRIQNRLHKVRKQKRLLDGARTMAWWHICEAKKVLDRESGVPRHKWAKARGRAWAAGAIYKILIYDYAALVAELL